MILPFGYTLEAEFHGSLLAFIGLAVLLGVFVVLANRQRPGVRGLNRNQLGIILFLRISAMMLLLLLVFDPTVSLKRERYLPKRIAVIVDRSESMNQAWLGNSSALKTAISGLVDDLEQTTEIELWSMDGRPLDPGSLDFIEDMSVFSWSPVLGAQDPDQDIYQAAIIISDGQLNGGRSPLDLTWTKALPLYPIFPLGTRANALLKLFDPGYTLDETQPDIIQIQAKIQHEGLIGKQASITIRDEFKVVIGDQQFRLNNVFTDLSIPIRLSGSGVHQLSVVLGLADGDLQTEKSLRVDQGSSQKRVLLVSERVNALHKFLLLNLPDSSFQVHSLIGTELAQAAERGISNIPEDYDLIILNRPGDQAYSEQLSHLIKAEIKYDCPVIIFQDNSDLLDEQWLDMAGLQRQAPIASYVRTPYWSESAQSHPFYLGLLGLGYNPADMLNYSPLSLGGLRLDRSGVELLITGRGEQVSSAFSLRDEPPLAVFTGTGYWKWFFHPQSKPSFQLMWEYLLLYLEDIAQFQPVTLDLPVSSAATGSFIKIAVSVSSMDNRLIKNAEVRVWQQAVAGNREELDLSLDNSGKYSANLLAKQPGETVIVAEAYRFGELWGRDTSTIELVAFSGEDQSKGVDEVFLERLAKRSGGKVIHLDQDELPNFPVNYYLVKSANHLRGVRSPAIFVILLTLLLLEWILRRRNGLL